MASIHWNIITRNIQLNEQLQGEVRQKLTRLEEHIHHFPQDKVHLQIAFESQAEKPLCTAQLTLRVPSNILHSEASAPDPMTAFDAALQTLLGELESGKARRRREAFEKPEAREQPQAGAKGEFTPAPQPYGTGPQNLQDIIRELFQQHYHRLLHHARRHIRHEELTGDLPVGALDARDIVDEVARQAEANPRRKPKKMSWLVWLFHLLHQELRRQREHLKQEQAEAIPIERRTTLPELEPKALQPLEQVVEKEIEPQIIRTEDVIPNPEAVPPDRFVEEKELLEELQEAIQNWPQPEREVFELYFVQGFEPDEIAQITGHPLKQVKETLAAVQGRLRQELLQEEALV